MNYADDGGTGRRGRAADEPRATVDRPDRPVSRLRLASADLFHGRREVVIVHGGHEYVLRITKSDKLILTK